MIMIGNLQYAWTLFVQPIMAATGWKLSEVQWGFTVFIAVMTWAMPLSGWLIDRLGPRVFMSLAGVLVCRRLGLAGACPHSDGVLCSLRHRRARQRLRLLLLHRGRPEMVSGQARARLGADRGGYGSGAALFIPLFSYLIRDHRAIRPPSSIPASALAC